MTLQLHVMSETDLCVPKHNDILSSPCCSKDGRQRENSIANCQRIEDHPSLWSLISKMHCVYRSYDALLRSK